LIWKLQKVYDENPDCGQLSGFGVQKSNKRLSAFFLADGRAFSMRYSTINFRNYKQKGEIKCESYAWLSGSVRERQGASKRVRFLIFPLCFAFNLPAQRNLS
jgi:hypothetical protein